MNAAQEAYFKKRALAAKRLVTFIRSRPDGVTIADLKAQGLSAWGLDRLLSLGLVAGRQVRDPERGPRAFHWLWKANAAITGGDSRPVHGLVGGTNQED